MNNPDKVDTTQDTTKKSDHWPTNDWTVDQLTAQNNPQTVIGNTFAAQQFFDAWDTESALRELDNDQNQIDRVPKINLDFYLKRLENQFFWLISSDIEKWEKPKISLLCDMDADWLSSWALFYNYITMRFWNNVDINIIMMMI